MRRPRPAAVSATAAVAATVITWSCSSAAPPEPESEGAKLYVANCAECHGMDAGGLKAGNLRTGLDADSVAAVVAEGRPDEMPSYAGTLSPDQIRTIAEYIHRIGTPTPD